MRSCLTSIRTVIGVDCATQEERVGLARATLAGNVWTLDAACTGTRDVSALARLLRWIESSPGSTLLALDAPLGWPAPMKDDLRDHQAGVPLTADRNGTFRRETDLFVAQHVGKTPLEVGADRIARTAHWTLNLLDELRKATQEAVPLAWSPHPVAPISAIEVYPAATLKARGQSLVGYKKGPATHVRRGLLPVLQERATLALDPDQLAQNPDVFDAAICVLAGLDFLAGDAAPPRDLELARSEGWIWVRL